MLYNSLLILLVVSCQVESQNERTSTLREDQPSDSPANVGFYLDGDDKYQNIDVTRTAGGCQTASYSCLVRDVSDEDFKNLVIPGLFTNNQKSPIYRSARRKAIDKHNEDFKDELDPPGSAKLISASLHPDNCLKDPILGIFLGICKVQVNVGANCKAASEPVPTSTSTDSSPAIDDPVMP